RGPRRAAASLLPPAGSRPARPPRCARGHSTVVARLQTAAERTCVMSSVVPPAWAEAVLRLVLSAKDRETVSGDLLEAYRDSIRPTRRQPAADCWYVRQVLGFVWRSHWLF